MTMTSAVNEVTNSFLPGSRYCDVSIAETLVVKYLGLLSPYPSLVPSAATRAAAADADVNPAAVRDAAAVDVATVVRTGSLSRMDVDAPPSQRPIHPHS